MVILNIETEYSATGISIKEEPLEDSNVLSELFPTDLTKDDSTLNNISMGELCHTPSIILSSERIYTRPKNNVQRLVYPKISLKVEPNSKEGEGMLSRVPAFF